jgi:predicted DNA binding CopG/RHH family protein
MKKKEKKPKDWMKYYDETNILHEITDDPVDLNLSDTLRQEILSGERKRRLKNVTIKVDPLQIIAIKKLSNIKSIPYQTLIRHWLSEGIRQELDSVLK